MKQIAFDTEKVISGVEKLARAVKQTMGAKGRLVIIDHLYGGATATKDGMTVAREVELEDPMEMTGVKMMQDMTRKVADTAGDGTTCATVLAEAFIKCAQEELKVRPQTSPNYLRKQLTELVAGVESRIDAMKTLVDSASDIENVATVSMNGDRELGKKIAEAAEKVGKDGVIAVEMSKGFDTQVEVTEGMQFNTGYVSPYFVTDPEKMVCEFEDAAILMTKKRIYHFNDILKIVESCHSDGRPLVIICDEIENDVVGILVENRLKRNLKVCVVRAPGFGDSSIEHLRDIAVVTGAKIVGDEDDGTFDNAVGGNARRVVITKDKTLIVNGATDKEKFDARVKYLREEVDKPRPEREKKELSERLARLVGGVAVIRVGGITEAEAKERKDRVDDAVAATKCAIEDGIVSGGGVALLRIADDLYGSNVFSCCLREPFFNIIKNGGYDKQEVLHLLYDFETDNHGRLRPGIGIDVEEGLPKNMKDIGVIDPAKVIKNAIKHAASTAATILHTGCVMTEVEDKKEE